MNATLPSRPSGMLCHPPPLAERVVWNRAADIGTVVTQPDGRKRAMASPESATSDTGPDGESSDLGDSKRLIGFTDAVVAIAMTILALDLPVPDGRTPSELWKSLGHDSRYFLSFIISFVII